MHGTNLHMQLTRTCVDNHTSTSGPCSRLTQCTYRPFRPCSGLTQCIYRSLGHHSYKHSTCRKLTCAAATTAREEDSHMQKSAKKAFGQHTTCILQNTMHMQTIRAHADQHAHMHICRRRATGEEMDLAHAASFEPVHTCRKVQHTRSTLQQTAAFRQNIHTCRKRDSTHTFSNTAAENHIDSRNTAAENHRNTAAEKHMQCKNIRTTC
ncbi:hypothetical protein I3760_03G080200 [Carya illinoinensis]|nr:hypothetical protein I3760_03G080200 [Carya illinoinensis]